MLVASVSVVCDCFVILFVNTKNGFYDVLRAVSVVSLNGCFGASVVHSVCYLLVSSRPITVFYVLRVVCVSYCCVKCMR